VKSSGDKALTRRSPVTKNNDRTARRRMRVQFAVRDIELKLLRPGRKKSQSGGFGRSAKIFPSEI
jgi:hypothetical protein